MLAPIPAARVAVANDRPVRQDGAYVLYWMIAARRTRHNFALQHAGWRAADLGKPLLVFEPLRVGYAYASDRLHQFVFDGMADNARRFDDAGIAYLPWVEPEPGAGKGLLAALARRACCVVTDDWPSFFLPRMVAAAARQVVVRLEAVDGNGLLPLAATEKAWSAAAPFRRHLQKQLPEHLAAMPVPDPLPEIARLGRARIPTVPRSAPRDVANLPIDHTVAPVAYRGGEAAGEAAVAAFLADGLSRYLDRNHPDADAASGLSPWLHFGHVSAHRVVAGVLARERWSPLRLGRPTGGRRGWWGLSEPAEAFLDELVTWRELGFAFARHRFDDRTRFEGLPDWARATLGRHRDDRRAHVYDLDAFAAGRTHDPVWNAAQRQLLADGRIHNYLRMLWGKKILEWTATPEDALDVMIHLNDRYAVDGRDPNSYSGIGWVLGRFDRAWGPERAVYGTVRYMSSASTVRKLKMKQYLARWGADGAHGPG